METSASFEARSAPLPYPTLQVHKKNEEATPLLGARDWLQHAGPVKLAAIVPPRCSP